MTLHRISRTFTTDEISVLQGLGLALDGDSGDRMIRCFVGEAGEAHSESILLEFDLLAAGEKPRGLHPRFQSRERDRFSGPKINVHVESVSLAREGRVIRFMRLAAVLGMDGLAIARSPAPDLGQDAHRLFRDRAAWLGANIDKIVSRIMGTVDEIAHDGLWSFPSVIRLVISPTFIQRHAGFPCAAAFVGDNLLLGR